MIKSKSKGARIERKTRDMYLKNGYHVMKSGGSFGVFDLCCMARANTYNFISMPDDSGGLTYDRPLWILAQVKSNRGCSKSERSRIKAFKVPPFAIKHIVIWKDYAREPEIEIYA